MDNTRSTRLPISDIPIAEDATSRFVPWIMGLLVFLLCLIVAAANSLNTSLHRWYSGMERKVTIEVPVAHEKDRESLMQTTLALVSRVPGVTRVTPVDGDHIFQILEPWIGQPDLLKDLPLPLLFDVDVRTGHSISWPDLSQKLRQIAAGARIEPHSRWQETFGSLRHSLQICAYIFAGLIILVALITVMLLTCSGLDTHRDNIHILQLLGATPTYIAHEFQKQAFRIALKGSGIGLAIAVPTLILFNLFSSSLDIPEIVRPDQSLHALLWLLIVPIFMIMLSVLVARFSVTHALTKTMR